MDFDNLTIADIRIGLFLTAIKLSDNSFGVASSLTDNHPFSLKENRDFGDFTPSKIKGQKVLPLRLSSRCAKTPTYQRTREASGLKEDESRSQIALCILWPTTPHPS